MAFNNGNNHLSVGTKVRVTEPTETPETSKWDDDGGRTSATLKKRIQTMFFQGNPRVQAEVLYIAKESERARLARMGQIKIRLRDKSGCMLNITADPSILTPAK